MKELLITDDMIEKAKKGMVEIYDINMDGVFMMLIKGRDAKCTTGEGDQDE